MKKTKLPLIAILALMMAGCANNNVAFAFKGPNLNKVAENLEVPSKKAAMTKWASDIESEMKTYLNGNVLPFFAIANDDMDIDTSWDDTYQKYYIYGDNFSTDILTAAKNAFDAAGWDTSSSTATVMTATLASKNLTVTVDKVGYSPYQYSGKARLTAVWNEPFDSTLFTAWNQDTLDMFDTHLHGHVLPLIYLGTTRYKTTWSSSSEFIEISGMKGFDDRIFTDNKTLLENDGWSVTVTSDSLKAMKAINGDGEDGCRVFVTIKKGSSNYNPTKLQAYVTPKFEEPVDGKWTSDTLDLMKTKLENHFIPYIYLGTTAETATYSENDHVFKITGGTRMWDDSILTKGLNTLTAAGWTAEIKDSQITGSIKAADKASMTIKVYNGNRETPIIEVVYRTGYNVPTGATWNSTTKAKFTANLGGNELPYVYLGTVNETSIWNSSNHTLTIKGEGGLWDDEIITEAEAHFDDTWTKKSEVTKKYIGYTSYDNVPVFKANKKMEDGSYLYVTLYRNAAARVLKDDYAILEVKYFAPFEKHEGGEWSADMKSMMNTKLDSHELPFVYMGDTVKISDPGADRSLTVTGNEFNPDILEEAKKAYSAAGWKNVKINEGSANLYSNYYVDYFTAEKTFDDDCKITVTLKSDTNDMVNLAITFSEGFNVPSAEESVWDDSIQSLMKSHFNNQVMPYFYIGTKHPEASWNSSYNYLQLIGGSYNSQIFDLAKASYTTSDGWNYTKGSDNYGATLTLNKTFDDTSKMKVVISQNSYKRPIVQFYFTAAYVVKQGGDWTNDAKSTLSTFLNGGELPYFAVAEENETYTISKKYSSDKYLTIQGGTWHDQFVDNAAKIFKNLGYTVTISSNSYGSTLSAIGKNADKSKYKIELQSNYNHKVEGKVYYIKPFVPPVEKSEEQWSLSIQTSMQANLGGNTLPYVYLGTMNPTASYSIYSGFSLKGEIWDEDEWDLFRTAFEGDTWNKWSVAFDYTSTNKAMMASCTTKDFGRITVKLTNNSDCPTLTCYYR